MTVHCHNQEANENIPRARNDEAKVCRALSNELEGFGYVLNKLFFSKLSFIIADLCFSLNSCYKIVYALGEAFLKLGIHLETLQQVF